MKQKKSKGHERASSKATKEIADYIGEALKGKLIIHRYDAFSTNSVYLKFDYGVANSLRISDHSGYDYLSYRYNIILGLKKPYAETIGAYTKEYYPPEMKDTVIRRILEQREEKVQRYKDYDAVVRRQRKKPDRTKSFWRNCREIK